ncbi:MAG TPA: O-antigen ligase family protein, partial [Vicinamibacterales bacterium]|nr:O-antigen ligase family protein [Vicinamibacterales bacterium]
VSLAFEGAKQGWFQMILNPGAPNTNESPFLGDNNGVAVGMLMLVPVITALAATSRWRLEKYVCYFLVVGVLYRAISTYSRGGFLSMLGLGLYYVLRTKRKIRTLLVVGVIAAIIYPVLPDVFWERMDSIQTAAVATDDSQMDTSSAGRLHFWKVAVEMANAHPILGIGFNSYNYQYDHYDFSNGRYGKLRAVHSAWFGMLAEMGYVGLIIFILLLINAFYVNFRARRLARTRPDMRNLVIYGTALEGALVVFGIGGSFVPHQYNEMLWHFIALTAVMDRLVRDRMRSPLPVPAAPPQRVERASAFTGVPRPLPTR